MRRAVPFLTCAAALLASASRPATAAPPPAVGSPAPAPSAPAAGGRVVTAPATAAPAAPAGATGATSPSAPAAAAPGAPEAGAAEASARPATSPSVVVWPTMTPAGDEAGALPLHRPGPAEQTVYARAQELDATLRDAAQDLGFTLYVGDQGPIDGRMRDTDLIDRAAKAGASGPDAGTWVVSPRIEYAGEGAFLVRIVAVPPKGRELRVRVDTVKGPDVSARGLVMLRDLLSSATAERAAEHVREQKRVDDMGSWGVMSTLHSQGRAVLAVNGALFGAFVAYSVQRASGNDDPRVLYPLLALGTGVGIGTSLLASEEWDISTGEAWFLAGGAWWGTAAGIGIANGRHVQPLSDRYAWGVGGGLIGLGLGVFAATRSNIDEGDAVLLHSGGALGLMMGSIAELAYRGTTGTDVTPYTGAGYGAAFGIAGAGALATFVQVSPTRVMLIDLGAGLGGLAGAALASPLVFEDVTKTKARGWLAATAGGAVLGGGLAWALTSDHGDAPRQTGLARTAARYGMPTAGVVAQSPDGTPAYGAGWQGQF